MSMKEVFEAIEKKKAPMEKIKQEIGEEEVLAQLAEEATELAQAALKLRRSLNGRNVTPVSRLDAEMDVQEEMADVLLMMVMVGIEPGEIAETVYKKVPRWCGRLGLI